MKYDNRSAEAHAYRYLYKTSRWRRLRALGLAEEPLCQMCLEQGISTSATVRDHVVPHKGDEVLFFDPENLQSLCKQHHDATKQAEERRGHVIGCSEDGLPLDPRHPWRV